MIDSYAIQLAVRCAVAVGPIRDSVPCRVSNLTLQRSHRSAK